MTNIYLQYMLFSYCPNYVYFTHLWGKINVTVFKGFFVQKKAIVTLATKSKYDLFITTKYCHTIL